ncbi:MAG: hypothetical protein WC595_04085 [Candidatus Nanoarchaeia archaeon]
MTILEKGMVMSLDRFLPLSPLVIFIITCCFLALFFYLSKLFKEHIKTLILILLFAVGFFFAANYLLPTLL